VITLDCTGMLCPLPIIELGRAFAGVAVGQELALISDDPAAPTDVAAWCRLTGHELVSVEPRSPEVGQESTTYVIRRLHADSG
jgi:tRNA 2-thiouridine synthesizing protein A